MRILEQYAEQVRVGLRIGGNYPIIPHIALGLTGEAGEVADVVKKGQYFGGAINFEKLEKECGDVLWYLQSFCNVLGLTLEQLAVKNIDDLCVKRPDLGYTPINVDS